MYNNTIMEHKHIGHSHNSKQRTSVSNKHIYPDINCNNIKTRHNIINPVKPSAPPASTNIYIQNDSDTSKSLDTCC